MIKYYHTQPCDCTVCHHQKRAVEMTIEWVKEQIKEKRINDCVCSEYNPKCFTCEILDDILKILDSKTDAQTPSKTHLLDGDGKVSSDGEIDHLYVDKREPRKRKVIKW